MQSTFNIGTKQHNILESFPCCYSSFSQVENPINFLVVVGMTGLIWNKDNHIKWVNLVEQNGGISFEFSALTINEKK